MKILLASSSSGSRGSGEIYLVYLARALVRLKHQVSLWASVHPRMDELSTLFAPMGAVHRSLYTNTYDRPGRSLEAYFDRAGARALEAKWRVLDFDILHLNKQNLEDGLDMLRAATRLRSPSVCTIHFSQSARYLGAKAAFVRDVVARRALRRYSGKLITVIEERAGDLGSFLHRNDRVFTIPKGVPVFALSQLAAERVPTRDALQLQPSDLLIIGVARMVDEKRPQLFIDIALKILERVPNARFLWIGDGPLSSEWDRKIAGHARISRMPWQSDVMPFLAAADVFLHVAEYEGLPLALLEAMAAGLPCAVTPNLLAEMPFLDATNCIAADTGDTAWIDYLLQPETMRSRGTAARAVVKRCFSYEQMAEACERLYREQIAAAS